MDENLRSKAKRVELIITDFDGVWTDGTITVFPDGSESVTTHAHDGMGVNLWLKSGRPLAIVTGRKHRLALRKRAMSVGVQEDCIFEGCEDKVKVFRDLLVRFGLSTEQVCYIGDDVQDLPLLQLVGLPAIPCDARGELVTGLARTLELGKTGFSFYKSYHGGGRGALRDLVEDILAAQKLGY